MTSFAGAVADEVETLMNWQPASPADLDETLRDVPWLVAAAGLALEAIGRTAGETGINPAVPEEIAMAAASLAGIADRLRERVGGGITRESAGRPAYTPAPPARAPGAPDPRAIALARWLGKRDPHRRQGLNYPG